MNASRNTFSKDKTNLLKSILPILIILHHCYFLEGMKFMGLWGVTLVALFFLISGYGLMSSYLKYKDAYLKNFLSKRLNKIIVPYLLCLLIYTLFSILLKNDTLRMVFSTDVGHWLPYSWFVIVITGGYLAFYVTFNNNLDVKKKIVLFSIVVIVYTIIGMCTSLARTWYASAYAMLVGIIWKYNENVVIDFVVKHKLVICIFSPLAMVLLSMGGVKIFNTLFASSLYILLIYALKESKYSTNKVVRFLSSISYEMYLIQAVAIQYITKVLGITNTLMALPTIIVMDIVLAYIINNVSSRIVTKIG